MFNRYEKEIMLALQNKFYEEDGEPLTLSEIPGFTHIKASKNTWQKHADRLVERGNARMTIGDHQRREYWLVDEDDDTEAKGTVSQPNPAATPSEDAAPQNSGLTDLLAAVRRFSPDATFTTARPVPEPTYSWEGSETSQTPRKAAKPVKAPVDKAETTDQPEAPVSDTVRVEDIKFYLERIARLESELATYRGDADPLVSAIMTAVRNHRAANTADANAWRVRAEEAEAKLARVLGVLS